MVIMTLPVITHQYNTNDPTGDWIPSIGWGKYVEENGRYKMTMHITVNHSLIDGKPLADAFNNIQNSLNILEL